MIAARKTTFWKVNPEDKRTREIQCTGKDEGRDYNEGKEGREHGKFILDVPPLCSGRCSK